MNKQEAFKNALDHIANHYLAGDGYDDTVLLLIENLDCFITITYYK